MKIEETDLHGWKVHALNAGQAEMVVIDRKFKIDVSKRGARLEPEFGGGKVKFSLWVSLGVKRTG